MSSTPGPTGAGARPGLLRIMLVDDHPVVRMGLAQLINDQPDMAVCGETGLAAEALDLARESRPDIMVVDLSIGESSGLELVKTLRASQRTARILVLSMHDERLFAERALRAGASGYIMKEQAARNLLAALRRVASGNVYLSEQMTDRTLAVAAGRRPAAPDLSPIEGLTDREREVFMLIGQGSGTRQIADGLHLSVKTIETYRAHIKEKLGLETATELIRFATIWADNVPAAE